MKLGLPLQEPAVPTSDRRLGVDVQLKVRSRGAWHNRLIDQARLEQPDRVALLDRQFVQLRWWPMDR